MNILRFGLYIILLLVTVHQVQAQTNDSLSKSTVMIDSLARTPKKTKIGKAFQKLVFKRPPNRNIQKIQAVSANELNDHFDQFQGKIIREININSYDPFGFNINDTTKKPTKKVEKIGNSLHLKTKPFTIRSLLLFKANQPLDSVRIKESERLIRSQRFIRRVRIRPVEVPGTDSVDLDIKVLDSWAIFPTGSLSTSSGRLNINTRNFAGLGHYLGGQYRTRFNTDEDALRLQYSIPNIAQTFISSNILYDKDLADNYVKTISLNRNFYSPLTRWAGGVLYNQTFYRDSVPNIQTKTYDISNFKYDYLNVWGGYSVRLYERYKYQRILTNFIVAARYFNQKYQERPSEIYDPYAFYNNQRAVLFSVGISSFNYVKDQYIFYDNLIEDIAVGKNLTITSGLQWKNDIRRVYLGSKLAWGNYYSIGYLGGSVEWGTYFNRDILEESVFRIEALYFSRIIQWGKWKFRQFVNPELVYGYNRIPYEKDRINLNGRNGIEGFDSYHLRGTKKLLVTFQTQSYAPYQWLGFRFNPFINASLGLIGDTSHKIFHNQLYTRLGVGVQINNDYLIFNRIQLSLSYFPYIPGHGRNIIHTNNLRNNHLQLQQFYVGQPSTVSFQ